MRVKILLVLWIVINIASLSIAEGPEKISEQKEKIVSVSGRLSLQPGKDRDRLLLHGKDAKIYIIYGGYQGLLESILSDLGERNLVCLSGTLSGAYNVLCHKERVPDESGNLIATIECFRQYHLRVTGINDAVKSDEEMPPPERDTEEEEKAKATTSTQQLDLGQIITREAKIALVNLKSPIKTIEINYQDKDKVLRKKALLVTSNTQIVKKGETENQPIYLSINALKPGQEVIAVYSTDELTGITKALSITITKE